MLHLALALTLAAAAPARPPVAPKNARVAIHVRTPKAGLSDLREFLGEAGAWTVALRPTELGRSLGALLGVDLLDPLALEGAGVDVAAPMTIAFTREATVVCLKTVKDGKTLDRIRATLGGSGQPAKLSFAGAQLEGATTGKAWRAGVATRGQSMCLASGGSDALAALKASAEAMAGGGLASTQATKAAAGLDAPVMGYFQSGAANGAFEIRPAKTALKLVGRAIPRAGMSLDKVKEGDPLAAFAPDAPFSARAVIPAKLLGDPSGPAADAVGFLVENACKECGPTVAKGLLDALRPELTGSVAMVARSIDPMSGTGALGRYYLAQHGYALALRDEAKGRAALEGALEKIRAKGASVTPVESPEGVAAWSIWMGTKSVFLGMANGVLFIANEAAAKDLIVNALVASKPAKAERAASFRINGPGVTSALRKISVLDVPRSPELAMLFAFGVEMGSLLKAAGPITGFAEMDGQAIRFETAFELKPAPKLSEGTGAQ